MQAEGENVGQAPDTSLARVSGFPHRRAPGAWLQCSWQARGPARHGLPPHHRAPNSTGLAQRLSSSPDIKVPSGCPKRLPAVGMRSVEFYRGAPCVQSSFPLSSQHPGGVHVADSFPKLYHTALSGPRACAGSRLPLPNDSPKCVSHRHPRHGRRAVTAKSHPLLIWAAF